MTGPGVVGILGGTFDPVHYGHLQLAEAVRTRLELERIVFMLAALPPHKRPTGLSPVHHREEMLRLAIAGHPGLELGRNELDRNDVTYTIDTMRELEVDLSPSRPVFLLGLDALVELPTWRAFTELLAEFDLIAVHRPDAEIDDVRSWHAEICERLVRLDGSSMSPRALADLDLGAGGRVFLLPIAPPAISSSSVRRRAALGASLERLVPPAVARYIQGHRLYVKEETR